MDALTGLGNRRMLRRDARIDLVAMSGLRRTPVTLVMFDIDCFKQYQ